MIDIFLTGFIGMIVLEFVVKRGLDLYLYVKEQLDEHIKY